MPSYTIEQFFGEDIIYLAMALAIPAHLLVIATFIKYRKTTFATSYFTLSCSLLLSDSLMCATTIVFKLFLRTPIGAGIIKNGTETIILWDQTIYSALSVFLQQSNQWALLIIAVNRFIFICFPANATNIWTPLITVISIVGQWAIGLLFGVLWRPSMQLVRDPVTGVEGPVPDVDEGKIMSTIIVVSGMSIIVVIFSLYMGMLCIIRAHRKLMSNLIGRSNEQQQNRNKTEIKLAVQAVVYSLFLVPRVVLSVLMIVMPPPPMDKPMMMTDMPVSQTFTYISNHVTDANYYTTSFVMLIMNQTLREHVLKVFTKNDPTSTIINHNKPSRVAAIKR